jgi:hypothetical protein
MSAITTLLNAIKVAYSQESAYYIHRKIVQAGADYFKEKNYSFDVILIIAGPFGQIKLVCSSYETKYSDLWRTVASIVSAAKKNAKSDFMVIEFIPSKGTAIPHDVNHV